MIASILVASVLVGGLAHALRAGRREGMISRRPYNNPYNDAVGARDDRLG